MGKKKPDVSLHKMFTLNFTWADFILGLIDGSIMALIQLLALGLIARQHNISSITGINSQFKIVVKFK